MCMSIPAAPLSQHAGSCIDVSPFVSWSCLPGASFVLEAENNSARHIFVPPASVDGKARPVTRIMTIRKVSTADREYCAASEDPVQLHKKKKRKEDGGEPTPASKKKAAKSDVVEAGQDETKKDKKHKKKKKAKEAAQVA